VGGIFEDCFDRFLSERPTLVLDLACGTGRMTRELSRRGYDMIGVDGSADMLSEAYSKGGEGILYLLQDMRSFELYGTVGAAVCCLDSINYLLEEKDVKKTFSLVHNYLDPDGIFIFDVNTMHKHENVLGDNTFVIEQDDVFCVWDNSYDKDSAVTSINLDFFVSDNDGKYERYSDYIEERAYSDYQIQAALDKAGFEVMSVLGELSYEGAKADDERVFYVARKVK
jgi:SAM-dependent methyltransferase